MVKLGPQSARASKAIRQAYSDHLDLLVLDEFADLESALWNGGLAPLPHDTLRFNVAPRLEGPSPCLSAPRGHHALNARHPSRRS